MKFYIYTLGCKVNTYESEMMREKLIAHGYFEQEENPDIVIVNTCSVTNVADQKSRKMVRHFKSLFPSSVLVVCGCSSLNKTSDYEEMEPDILLGNTRKSDIVDLIEQYMKTNQRYENVEKSRDLTFEDMNVKKFSTHTRAYMKIQDGCDNFCSYCVIPFVRGKRRNKNFDECYLEAEELVKNGHQEIVLTGIHTGSYEDQGHDLTDVIHEISKLDGLKRIRISSIEVTELTDKFLNELKNNPKICPHLHIPLQAGSDKILSLMNRKYDLNDFEEKLKQIRLILPDISISTDIIVGFPCETEEDMQETLLNAKKFAFSKVHVFPYSKREGTKASRMENQVIASEKKRRSKELVRLSNQLEREYALKFDGKVMSVLIENNDRFCVGSTSNYLKVFVEGSYPPNTLLDVKLHVLEDGRILGKVMLGN
ncbi:MAG: tRNA (N(6)-L-threonylcarbamoyladenosine(37)-C(2))-methylthiotransferase MtaB [Bacilli bacterium]|nr:tRNA (N(6)-L-threonylcarbamoyladenosine(37)-C(2))-methylthiotransferase MtaB [Bacilli bacterium]